MDLSDMTRHVTDIRAAEVRVGGKYALTTLLQKRAVELMRGAPRLVEAKGKDLTEIALQEILAGKIELVVVEEQPATGEAAPAA